MAKREKKVIYSWITSETMEAAVLCELKSLRKEREIINNNKTKTK
jgi:hypothetical protein